MTERKDQFDHAERIAAIEVVIGIAWMLFFMGVASTAMWMLGRMAGVW